ncbi:MAG: DUF6495 family protein [Bacteroidota bacterium]
MQYRCLTDQELKSLETEFKQFLVSHGVMNEEWRQINAETPEKAQELVELFSDVVFGKVVEKVEYMIHRAPQDLKVFHFGAEQMSMLGLKLLEPSVNLEEPPYLTDLGLAINDAGTDKVKLMRGRKGYQKSREEEAFILLEQGCEITTSELFDRLKALQEA